MLHRARRVAVSRLALTLVPALVAAVGLPARAAAATVTPTSDTTCYGSLSHDPTGKASGEPNLLDYKFLCNTNIVAYTILVNRGPGRPSTVDDYNPSPLVVTSQGTTSSTEAPGCSGTTPGPGINCNIGSGSQIDYFNTVEGSIDPIGSYCAYYPTGAKKGSLPVPQAQVELIVSNSTGAEDGPFPLGLKQACPTPKAPWTKHKKRAKHKSAKTTHKAVTRKKKA
jgi:hypothetical protein